MRLIWPSGFERRRFASEERKVLKRVAVLGMGLSVIGLRVLCGCCAITLSVLLEAADGAPEASMGGVSSPGSSIVGLVVVAIPPPGLRT